MKSHKPERRQTKKTTKRPYSRREPAPLPQTEICDVNQIVAAFGISATTWWEGVRKGYFPKPLRLGPRMTRWRTADVRKLLEEGTSEWKPNEIRKNGQGVA